MWQLSEWRTGWVQLSKAPWALSNNCRAIVGVPFYVVVGLSHHELRCSLSARHDTCKYDSRVRRRRGVAQYSVLSGAIGTSLPPHQRFSYGPRYLAFVLPGNMTC
jgi:hypothetical protein